MRAIVRDFVSTDIDLDTFSPEDPDNFSFLLLAFVGPFDSEGEEQLQLVVCTPKALAARVESEKVVFGRPLVIVGSSDVPQILRAVRKEIESIEASSWNLVASRLARLGLYEFEDFF